MTSSKSQIEYLKELLSLEEKRAELQSELSTLESEIDSLKQQFVSGVPAAKTVKAAPAPAPKPVVSAPAPKSSAKPATKSGKPAKAGRGELKSVIFAALEKAGEKGVRVLDLAHELGTAPANIYAWFHAAVKRYPEVKKIGSAEYRLGKAGKSTPAKAPAPAPKAVKASKASKPAAKPVKASKSASSSKDTGSNKRGALQAKIIEALRSAGSSGIQVKQLAERFNLPYRNIQVWFATTGKKHSGIRKIAPATYRFVG